MNYSKDTPYSDVFECNGDSDFHDYYYISPQPYEENSCFYRLHRTGIESQYPTVFFVKRSASTQYCELFCIFTGKGELTFRDKEYQLGAGQIVILPSGEGHSYRNRSENPLGMTWIEFYGGESENILRKILENKDPIIEGTLFSDISKEVSLLQQRLMMEAQYDPSVDLYRILLLLDKSARQQELERVSEQFGENFKRLDYYMDAHLFDSVTNQEMASYCGLSLSCFTKHFIAQHHMPPQKYFLRKKIGKARQLLLQSDHSIDRIAEILGFCNTSHFIRRFQQVEHMSPRQYRKEYKIPGFS